MNEQLRPHLKAFSVVVGVLILIGLVMTGVDRSRSQAPSAAGGVEQLPDFSTKTLDGREIASSGYSGKILIVNFWASWCGPCVEEVPSLVKLSKEMGDRMRILAISSDSSIDDINVFLKSFPEFQREGIDLVFDGGQGLALTKKFSVGRLPESFVFDGNGKMIRKVVGSINWASDDALTYLRDLAQKTVK